VIDTIKNISLLYPCERIYKIELRLAQQVSVFF